MKSFDVVHLTDAQMGVGKGGWWVRSMIQDHTTAGSTAR